MSAVQHSRHFIKASSVSRSQLCRQHFQINDIAQLSGGIQLKNENRKLIGLFFCFSMFSVFSRKKIKKRLDFLKNRCKLQFILKMPTWRNGRRAAFRSQSPHGGVGSTPIVGTIFSLKIANSSPFLPHFCCGILFWMLY